MVDVGAKASTERLATAQATVFLQPDTLEKIQHGKIAKGDVLAVAQVAGVMGAKKTPDLIPMCHPILLTSVDISFKEASQPDRDGALLDHDYGDGQDHRTDRSGNGSHDGRFRGRIDHL